MSALQPQPALYPFIHGQQIRLKEACYINDEPHFTRRAIGEWLCAPHPYLYVKNIVDRNPHIKVFSTRLNLSLVEGGKTVTREVEVYSPIGLQLILMKSNLPKAIEYQIAVAHLVQAYMRGELKPPKRPGDIWLQLACEEASDLIFSRERGNAVRAITEKFNVHRATVYRWLKRIEQGENPSEKQWGIKLKGSFRYIGQETIDLMYELIIENPKITAREIIRRVPCVDCSAIGTVWKIKRQALKELGAE